MFVGYLVIVKVTLIMCGPNLVESFFWIVQILPDNVAYGIVDPFSLKDKL